MILKAKYVLTGDGKTIIENGAVATQENIIIAVGTFDEIIAKFPNEEVTDYGDRTIMPGMIDMHVHAPQFAFRGTSMDLELMDWLNRYTFPEEEKYANVFGYLFAKSIESDHSWRHGDPEQFRLVVRYSPGHAIAGELYTHLKPEVEKKVKIAYDYGKQFFKDLKVFFLYNKYNLVKSCTKRIVYRVVKNKFAVRSDRVKLFQSAVSAAHSCSHN